MADLLGTDEFLVNRNDVTYTQEQETLMASLQDTDHLLINRAGQTYKITGSDLINSVTDPLEITVILAPIDGYTDTEVTAVPVVSGGKQPDGGYIFTYQWVTADDATGTNKTNIAGANSSTFTPDNAQVGLYLGCVVSTIDALGTTAEGESYIGPIQVLAQAPVIADVVVSEIYDGQNRFTDKEFPYITTMAIDGEPDPTFEVKAKLSGTTFDFDVKSDVITDVESGGIKTCETDTIETVDDTTDAPNIILTFPSSNDFDCFEAGDVVQDPDIKVVGKDADAVPPTITVDGGTWTTSDKLSKEIPYDTKLTVASSENLEQLTGDVFMTDAGEVPATQTPYKLVTSDIDSLTEGGTNPELNFKEPNPDLRYFKAGDVVAGGPAVKGAVTLNGWYVWEGLAINDRSNLENFGFVPYVNYNYGGSQYPGVSLGYVEFVLPEPMTVTSLEVYSYAPESAFPSLITVQNGSGGSPVSPGSTATGTDTAASYVKNVFGSVTFDRIRAQVRGGTYGSKYGAIFGVWTDDVALQLPAQDVPTNPIPDGTGLESFSDVAYKVVSVDVDNNSMVVDGGEWVGADGPPQTMPLLYSTTADVLATESPNFFRSNKSKATGGVYNQTVVDTWTADGPGVMVVKFQNNACNGSAPATSTFNFSSSDGVTCSEGATWDMSSAGALDITFTFPSAGSFQIEYFIADATPFDNHIIYYLDFPEGSEQGSWTPQGGSSQILNVGVNVQIDETDPNAQSHVEYQTNGGEGTIVSTNTNDNTLLISSTGDRDNRWIAGNYGEGSGTSTDFYVAPANAVPITQDYAWVKLQIINNKAQVTGIQQDDPGFLPVPAKDYSIKFPAVFPTGNEPDDDLPRGTCVAAIVAAENSEGRSVKESNCFMPADVNPEGAAGPITDSTPTQLTLASNANLGEFSPGDNLVMVDQDNKVSDYTMQTSLIENVEVALIEGIAQDVMVAQMGAAVNIDNQGEITGRIHNDQKLEAAGVTGITGFWLGYPGSNSTRFQVQDYSAALNSFELVGTWNGVGSGDIRDKTAIARTSGEPYYSDAYGFEKWWNKEDAQPQGQPKGGGPSAGMAEDDEIYGVIFNTPLTRSLSTDDIDFRVLTYPDTSLGTNEEIANSVCAIGIYDQNGDKVILYGRDDSKTELTFEDPNPDLKFFRPGDMVQGEITSGKFSTTLYTGTGAEQSIDTGIDNTTKSLLWLKKRNETSNHVLVNTENGFNNYLKSNSSDTMSLSTDVVKAALNNGFTVGTDGNVNKSGQSHVAWNFRAAPNFMDIVTWIGTGDDKEIPHSLNSSPGLIITKSTSTANGWYTWHNSFTNQEYLVLNEAYEKSDVSYDAWGDVTDESFGARVAFGTNTSNQSYVAYLFADTPGVIKCGSYTGNGGTNSIDCGFEPGWVMYKNSSASSQWLIYDNQRNAPAGNPGAIYANLSNAEDTDNYFSFTETGFQVSSNQGNWNESGNVYVYVAIADPGEAYRVISTDLVANTMTVDGGEWVQGNTVEYGPVTGTGTFQSADLAANTITMSVSNDRWIDTSNRLGIDYYVRDNITVLNADNPKHVALQQAIADAFTTFPQKVNERRTAIASSFYRLMEGEALSAAEFALLEETVIGAVNATEPVALDGYYPLYYTAAKADAASSEGTHHTHTFNGITYYMPDGGSLYHGNYI